MKFAAWKPPSLACLNPGFHPPLPKGMGFLLAPPARRLKSVGGGAKADKNQRTNASQRFAPIAKIIAKQRLIASGFAQVLQKCLDSVRWL